VVAELLGWFAASLPQVVRAIRAEQLDGISSATYWLVLANAAAWTVWSLFTGEYAAGVPALVNGPVAIVILHRLAVARHDTPDPGMQQRVERSDVRPSPWSLADASPSCRTEPMVIGAPPLDGLTR
jgi:uncharacterized protein with PQ loop repeat